jgi:anaerobic magnesium-protoporphyrin IX monomethyl ester cyclase
MQSILRNPFVVLIRRSLVMQSVLLANSYFLMLDEKQVQKMRPYPPLATLYVAANLRARGYEVEVFDATFADDETAFETMLDLVRPSVVVLYEDNFNFLSKMCLSRMREAALTMASAAKRRGAFVLASGSDVTDHPDLYVGASVDLAVIGEGDHTVPEVLEWLTHDAKETGRPTHIAGLAFAGPGETLVRSTARRNERHPDVFAQPARDLLDIERYRAAWTERHGEFSLNMVSTRGCPFHCNWCAKPIWGQRYAMRTPSDVAAEMADVKTRFRPDHIWFADDIFGLRSSWVSEFADELIRRDAVIPFTIQSRCELMTEQAVAGLARAGCREVWMGAESGSQRVLDAMEKGITVEQIRDGRRRLGDAGIRACYFTQFGYPGERWEDIEATIELIRDTLPDDIGVSVSYPLPGTRFHTMVAEELGSDANWELSGDLRMMFRGTYTTEFYRHLHVALHDDLALRRRRVGLDATDHPSLAPVSLAEQEVRVALAWETLEELRFTCRSDHPTLLVRSGAAAPVPDLSLPYN